jgi:Fe-S oxidoreductase
MLGGGRHLGIQEGILRAVDEGREAALRRVASGAPVAATDCPLAALQIEQGTGRKPKHPIEVLAAAYGFEA